MAFNRKSSGLYKWGTLPESTQVEARALLSGLLDDAHAESIRLSIAERHSEASDALLLARALEALIELTHDAEDFA